MKDSAKAKFRKIESKRKLASRGANSVARDGERAETGLTDGKSGVEISSARGRTLTAEARKKMSIASLMNTVQLDDKGFPQRTIHPPHSLVSQPQSIHLPSIRSLNLPLPLVKTLGADSSAALNDKSFVEDFEGQHDAGSSETISQPLFPTPASLNHSDKSEQEGSIPIPEHVQIRLEANEQSYTHPELLAMAILASPECRESHTQICIWISDQFPYFRHLGLAKANKSPLGKRFIGLLERNKLFKKHKISQNKVLWSLNPDFDCSGLKNKLRLIQKRTQTLDCSLPNPLPERPTKKGDYGCLICAWSFAHRLDLDHHVATAHPRLHKCDCTNCAGKSQPGRLRDAKPELSCLCRFPCNDCDSKFRLSGDLVVHARKSGHSINEDYTNQVLCKCAECGRSFVTSSSLQRHGYFSKHTISGLPPRASKAK